MFNSVKKIFFILTFLIVNTTSFALGINDLSPTSIIDNIYEFLTERDSANLSLTCTNMRKEIHGMWHKETNKVEFHNQIDEDIIILVKYSVWKEGVRYFTKKITVPAKQSSSFDVGKGSGNDTYMAILRVNGSKTGIYEQIKDKKFVAEREPMTNAINKIIINRLGCIEKEIAIYKE